MVATLQFDNRFIRELPGDSEIRNFTRQINDACWSYAPPTPVADPQLLAYSREMADTLDFSAEDMASNELLQSLSGNILLPGMEAYATCYGGHQFGQWAGQLGDGRAIYLGELITQAGERWELQLKGAGPTPYSRRADGRAVLRSSLREFLCSEAMHHLGVPTTRALSLVTTGEGVMRDMFYNGNARLEPGAIVCRVAPSFTRFGHFQMLAARGELTLLKQLVDFTIDRDFNGMEFSHANQHQAWFGEICERTARMVAHWMRVGFVHGVMNTDNMSILGLTIDYGPYGWIDNFDPNWTPNTTDANGRRYCFGRQPQIARWNIAQLGQSLSTLIGNTDGIERGLERYDNVYANEITAIYANKFGFAEWHDDDVSLVSDIFSFLQQAEIDMTIFFRQLAHLDASAPDTDILREAFYDDDMFMTKLDEFSALLNRYSARVKQDGESHESRFERMNSVNPRFVLRNYIAQQAIDRAEQGDASMIEELLDVLRKPYDEQPEKAIYAAKRPEWARHKAGCSMLSCSS